MQKLINTTSSGEWMEGYPIGNGRLAAMVWDTNDTDILSLNHEWLWRGWYKNQSCKPGSQNLQEVRKIFKTLSLSLNAILSVSALNCSAVSCM